ncbi:hypothetical protein MGG_16020, partial [Pyricularia oryzae 70-15]
MDEVDESPTSPRGIPESLGDVSWLLSRIEQQSRCPRNAASWLNEVKSTTAKILFEISFPTWFAYRLTRHAAFSNSHFEGKSELKAKLHWFEAQGEETKLGLARQVSNLLSPSAIKKINTWKDMTQNKRKRNIDEIEDDCTSATTTTIAPETAIASQCMTATTESLSVFHHASLNETRKLFPRRIYNAIVRSAPCPGTIAASITTISPTNSIQQPCQVAFEMRIKLASAYIPTIAKDLFDANVVENNGVISLQTPTYTVVPSPSLTLKGCRLLAIPEIFGVEVAEAIHDSFIYQGDISYGYDTTSSV